MKLRLRKTVMLYVSVLLGGIAYALICTWLGFGIPCLIRTVTGLMCPGCGISRMCIALLKLDFQTAFASNPVVFILLPFLAAVLIDTSVRYVKTGSSQTKGWSTVLVCIMAAVLFVYGIVRNIV